MVDLANGAGGIDGDFVVAMASVTAILIVHAARMAFVEFCTLTPGPFVPYLTATSTLTMRTAADREEGDESESLVTRISVQPSRIKAGAKRKLQARCSGMCY